MRLNAAGGIQSSGHLLAGSDTNSQIVHAADLRLESQGNIRASGSLLGKKEAQASGRRVDVSAAQVAASGITLSAREGGVGLRQTRIDGDVLAIATPGDIDAQQAVIGAGRWDVSSNNLFNQNGVWSQTGRGTSRFALSGGLDNREGSIEARSLALNAASLSNHRGRLVALDNAEQRWQFSGVLDNSDGELGSNGDLLLTAGRLVNPRGTLQTTSALTINSAGAIDNSHGSLLAGQDLRLTARDFHNTRGKTIAGQALGVTVTQTLDNAGGELQSGGELSLKGSTLSNRQSGLIYSQQGMALDFSAGWDNQGGSLVASGNARVQAGSLINAGGTVNVLGALDMGFSGLLNNTDGRIFSQSGQTLAAQDIDNTRGWAGGMGGWSASTGQFINAGGSVQSLQGLSLTAGWLNNAQGVLQSAAELTLQLKQEIDNRAGKISAQGNLTATAAGEINNAGGQWQAGEGLKLSAKGLDNTLHGLLYSQKGLTLKLKQQLDNRQGSVQGGGPLTLEAQTLNNAGGSLDGQQMLILRILGLLDNRSGAVRSNGNQQVTAAGINNSSGMFSSRGDLHLAATQLDNANGALISLGTGIYRLDTLNNQQGKVHSADALTLNTKQLNNQNGQLVSTRALTLQADQLNNSGKGAISSQTSLVVQADSLNNRDGGRLLATSGLRIAARAIDNMAGQVQSAGNLTLTDVSQLDNRQGRMLANGALDINAAHPAAGTPLVLLNQSGRVESAGALTLRARTLENQGGTLLGLQALTLSAQQDYTRRAGETISSNGTVTFSVSGAFNNLVDWLLPGNLTLIAASITNPAQLVGKAVQLTAGALQNDGRLEGDTLSLNVDTLNNTATLMGDAITVRGRVIDNHAKNAAIAATESLILLAREALLNREGALIYSGDRLTLRSDDLIENRASSIEADGDVTLEAKRLNNLREGLVIERDAETSDYRWHRYNYFWRSYGSGVNPDKETMRPTTQQMTFRDAAAQTNPYGTLLDIDSAGKRARVQVKDNRGQLTELWVNYLALKPNADGSYAMTFYQTNGPRQEEVPTPYHNTVWREHNRGHIEQWDPQQHVDVYSAPHVSDYNNFRERSVTGTLTRDRLVSEGIGARILAGGNMALRITGQLLNDASAITANRNLIQSGEGVVINRGYSVNERRQEHIVDHMDKDTVHWFPTYDVDETTAIATVDAILTGNGNVTINGASITNTTVNQAQISQLAAALKAVDAERAGYERNPLAFTVNGDNASSASGRPLLPAELALTAQQHLSQVATSIPDNGLFSQSPAAGSAFLIVTDPRFTSRETFISSDYLLEQVGYNPAQVHKRLGDGFYEQRLVREQIAQLTGRPSIKGWDAMAQYQQLMSNGAAVAQDFHLVPGVALTPAQIAALRQDIVWLVSETVQTAGGPQKVWVPKVYLAQSTLRLTGDGAMMGGGNLQLSANSITNAGNLFADQALAVDAGTFLHQGGDIRADNINVQADSLTMSTNLQDALRQATMSAGTIALSGSDVLLQGAKLDATQNLSLSARNNLEIAAAQSSHSADLQVIAGAMGNRTTNGTQTPGAGMASISGEWQRAQGSELTAGGNLSLSAGQDITLQGSQARAGGTAQVAAGGDITLKAATTTNNTHLEASSRTSSVSNSRQEERLLLSTLAGDQNVTLMAGNSLLAEGAQVTSAEGRIGVSASEVTIMDARQQIADRDAEKTRQGKTKRQREMETVRETSTGSTFSGQQGVTAIAREGSATVTGSTLHSGQGDIVLAAKEDVTLTSATESESRFSESRAKSKGFMKKTSSHTVTDERTTTEKGALLSGETVRVQVGNDLLIYGSSVAANGDVALAAGNNVTVEAATNTASNYSLHEKKKSGVFSGGSGFGVTVGSQSSKTVRDGAQTTQSDARSLIGTTGGNVVISAGEQVTLSAADLVAGRRADDTSRKTGHIDITASNISVLPGRDSVAESVKQESKSSGLSLSVKAPFEDTVRNVRDILSGKNGSSTVDNIKALGAEGGALGLDGPGNLAAVSAGKSKSSSSSHYQGEFSSGSNLSAAGNVQLNATGGDILVAGSRIAAGEAAILEAQRDIRVVTSTDREVSDSKSRSSGWSLSSDISAGAAVRATTGGGARGGQVLPGGMSEAKDYSALSKTTQNASVIEGADIYLNSREGSVDIRGSGLAARDDLVISALKGNVSVTAGENGLQQASAGSSKTIGTLGGDGYGATAGYSRERHSSSEEASQGSDIRSRLTSQDGHVIVQAGQDVTLAGTDVAAGKSVSLSGRNVLLDVSRDSREGTSRSSQSQYGVTASAGGWAVEAAKTAEQAARSAEDGDDARLAGIRAGQAAASAAQGAMSDAAVVKGKVAVTAGRSSQGSSHSSTQTQGTAIAAGENVSIRAENDITGRGVQISGRQVTLDAGRDILLTASEDTSTSRRKNSGSQFSIGAGVSLIGAQNGISLELGASQQKGRESSQAQHHTNSAIRAEEQLTVSSGRDTTLQGAELAGNRVVVNTGRDLTISSVQDRASYDSRQSSSGANLSLCVPPLCYGASSGSVSASGENITQDGRSVISQSGIYAGSGGFDITVGNHTQLDGAVIASAATADKNRLETGTLGWTDIRNESKTSGDSYTVAVSGSAGGGGRGENRNLAPATGTGHAEENRSGTTSSVVSNGTLIVRDQANQTQDTADLSRDPGNAHHGVDVNGDVQKVRDNLAVQAEGMALATSALDAYGKYAQRQAEEANAALEARLAAEGKLDGQSGAQREATVKAQPEYRSTDYGPGSDYWTRGSAAAGLLAGALGGNLKAGAAAGAAPLLASLVKEQENPAARAALHGIVAAALTQLAGGSGTEGLKASAAGAVTASVLTEHLVSALYGKDSAALTADERRLVSSLVTLAGAGMGYAAGGEVSLAATGAGAAKAEVENNSLRDKDKPPVNIFDINPMLKIGVIDENGDSLKGGGGIAKGGKSKDTQIWTETKKAEPVGNAYGHWTKHGKEFPEYQNAKQYAEATHTFVNNPPAGTLTTTRKNGDTIYYNPSSNTFAVKNAEGVPKTMFRPDPADHGYPTNLDYFNAQK